VCPLPACCGCALLAADCPIGLIIGCPNDWLTWLLRAILPTCWMAAEASFDHWEESRHHQVGQAWRRMTRLPTPTDALSNLAHRGVERVSSLLVPTWQVSSTQGVCGGWGLAASTSLPGTCCPALLPSLAAVPSAAAAGPSSHVRRHFPLTSSAKLSPSSFSLTCPPANHFVQPTEEGEASPDASTSDGAAAASAPLPVPPPLPQPYGSLLLTIRSLALIGGSTTDCLVVLKCGPFWGRSCPLSSSGAWVHVGW